MYILYMYIGDDDTLTPVLTTSEECPTLIPVCTMELNPYKRIEWIKEYAKKNCGSEYLSYRFKFIHFTKVSP